MTFVINRHVERTPFVLLRIKAQYANVHQAIEEILFQKLVVNWPTHVHNVTNHQCVKLQQPGTYANVQQDILDSLNQLAVYQLANVKVIHSVRIVLVV